MTQPSRLPPHPLMALTLVSQILWLSSYRIVVIPIIARKCSKLDRAFPALQVTCAADGSQTPQLPPVEGRAHGARHI